MVTLTINIPNEENRILELYKTKRGFKNKHEAMLELINNVRDQFSEEDIKSDWRNDPISDKQKFRLKEMGIEFRDDMTKIEAFQLIKENLK